MPPSGGETDVAALIEALLGFPVDLSAWARAGARTLPTVLLVPAFGLGFLPATLRLSFAMALSLPLVASSVSAPFMPTSALAMLPAELVRGTFVAIAAAAALWAASVAGGLADHAMSSDGSRKTAGASVSVLLGLASAVLFFELGGAARLGAALGAADLDARSAHAALAAATTGLDLGVALAVPLLIVGLVVDVASALVARELTGLGQTVFAPLRSLSLLLLLAALFESLLESIGRRT